MIAVAEAEKLIKEHQIVPAIRTIALENCLGHTLATEVRADRDLPPYPRVAMDGIAIFYGGTLPDAFHIEHVHAAGDPPYTLRNPAACVEVMTGAVLPAGTNAVIPYEELTLAQGMARVHQAPRPNQHIHGQGADVKRGERLIPPGTLLTPTEVAVLAAVGYSEVPVYEIPTVAIVSTGNELVEVDTLPGPHQIRMSNSYAVAAALAELKIASKRYHLPDDLPMVRTRLLEILNQHAIVILSGGVSKGKFDLIPEALAKAGVKKQFHQIRQKPGKPFWFGRSTRNTVFALPGNPVSTFLCFHRYIRPWLQLCMGQSLPLPSAQLSAPVTFAPSLTYFLPVQVTTAHGIAAARPVPGGGSGDFVSLLRADGFLELPPDRSEFLAGEHFPLWRFR